MKKRHTHVDDNGHLRWGTLEKGVRLGILFFSVIGFATGWYANYKLLTVDVREVKQDVKVLEHEMEAVKRNAAVTRNDIQYIKQGVDRLLRKELGDVSLDDSNMESIEVGRKTFSHNPVN